MTPTNGMLPIFLHFFLALTRTANLEVFTLEAGFLPAFPFLPPETLPTLARISFIHPEGKGGTCLSTIAGIMHSAPALKTIHCHTVYQTSMPNTLKGLFQHENVATIRLHSSALLLEHLEYLMKAFPNLENFHYESGGAVVSELGEATPLEISQALAIRSNSLKHVTIDLENASYVDDEDPMVDLTSLEKLEKQELCGECLYEDDEEPTSGRLIVNPIPRNL